MPTSIKYLQFISGHTSGSTVTWIIL